MTQPGLGLGDTGFDPDILTKEIDHDFFDDPLSSAMVAETESRLEKLSGQDSTGDNYGKCQFGGTVLPNKFAASEPDSTNDVRLDKSIRSKHYEEGEQNGSQRGGSEVDVVDHQSSGRSSDLTVHLEMEKEEDAAASGFYSIESNATSPNYPRPKQCYQLQQRRKSLNSFKKYLGHIDNESDCSDLTEVSPLSSTATSPLPPPPQYITEFENGDINLETEHLCSAADGLHICHDVATIHSQLEAIDNMQARFGVESGVARLPLIISGSETAVIPKENSCQDPNGGDPEEGNTLKANEQEICIDCCLETAKKILSRDSSPSRKGIEFLPIAEDEERSASCYSTNSFSVSIPRDDSSRSSSSAWSATNLKGVGIGATIAVAKGRASSSGSASSTSSFGSVGKRPPKNYTFTSDQMKKIERENQILLRKILDTHKGGHHHHHTGRNCHRSGHNHKVNSASTSIARLRQQRRIKHENEVWNLMLMKRLQTVKPSKDIEDAFKTGN
ncbi:Cilia- and flagella-associated protein 97 [Orchesella cincta]|uniref:Cilia-and flagella-associated protein 97 n=1 Tax=Orchesella cincta TaxID=48709 RepID=A0A1D2NBM9_ORCCI|nr:Cilia- and flagella-associated protein 97 [Orchesella cincta]